MKSDKINPFQGLEWFKRVYYSVTLCYSILVLHYFWFNRSSRHWAIRADTEICKRWASARACSCKAHGREIPVLVIGSRAMISIYQRYLIGLFSVIVYPACTVSDNDREISRLKDGHVRDRVTGWALYEFYSVIWYQCHYVLIRMRLIKLYQILHVWPVAW